MNKIVLFDLDGTLLDTSEGIFTTARYTGGKLGLEDVEDEKLKGFVGPPLPEAFKVVYDIKESLLEEAMALYKEHYDKEGGMYKAKVYDGIVEVLKTLASKNYILAVATLKTENLAKDILSHFGLKEYFTIISGANEQNSLTKADIIQNAIAQLPKQEQNRVILIGDTPHDCHGSKKVGIDFIAVSWGFGTFDSSLDQQEHLIAKVDQPHELLNYL